MVDTCHICPGSSVHKLGAYITESDSPSLSDRWSTDGKPSCELDVSQGIMQLLPEASDELGTLIRNDGLRHTMQT
jgi:hypothetical protein